LWPSVDLRVSVAIHTIIQPSLALSKDIP